jgi:phosphinothricin acetyltransferase
MTVRDLRQDDWLEVSRIYGQGIATGNATFETEVPSWEAWDATHLVEHRYVAEDARGRGVGRELLAAAVESSERAGIWTLQTGVFPENAPSLGLLRRFGFRTLGTQERIGRLHGVWRDVVLLERRSEVVT